MLSLRIQTHTHSGLFKFVSLTYSKVSWHGYDVRVMNEHTKKSATPRGAINFYA